MDLSIVICTYNRAPELRRTLEVLSALQPPAGVSAEVVVVDNRSDDETPAVCRAWRGALPLRTLSEEQQGKSFALNRAIRETDSALLVFTDDDVDVAEGWLSALWSAASAHPECAFLGGKVISRWERPPPKWFVDNLDQIRSNPRVDFGEAKISITPEGKERLIGANLAFRRSALLDCAFRTDLGPQGDGRAGGRVGPEELEFEERLLAGGARGLYVPGAVVYHRDPPHRMTRRYLARWYFHAGQSEVRQGWVPRENFWFGAPRYLWRELLTELARFLLGNGSANSKLWVSALCRGARAWGSITALRAERAPRHEH